jgi:hypothetical protein
MALTDHLTQGGLDKLRYPTHDQTANDKAPALLATAGGVTDRR